jgi:hypothetical protein
VVALVLTLLPGLAVPALAQNSTALSTAALTPEDLLVAVDPAALEEFRADLELLALILDRQVGDAVNTPSLSQKIRGLSHQELVAFFHLMPPEGLDTAVKAMADGVAKGLANQGTPRRGGSKVIVGTNDAEFEPGYPEGPNYDVFTATLTGLGAISDSDSDGQINDERCTDQYEAGLQIAIAVAAVANSAAQGACAIAGADPTGIATAVACAISTATDLVQVSIEIAIAQCDFQSGAVDSAELQAAYENTRILVSALTCKNVPSLRKGHGCDGQDADCDLVADECAEDVFGPDVSISGNMSARWFLSAGDAAAAVSAATSAIDDCQSVTVQPAAISGACDLALATVSAQDACGNESTTTAPVQIDGVPPALAIGSNIPGSCHTSIASAEAATQAAITVSDNCTPLTPGNVFLTSTVTECSLRIRATATDLAGLSTTTAATVRVDTEQPRVEIERLLVGTQLPFCYATAAAAEASVFSATRFTDNCTATENLAKTVSSSGDLCNLQVTSHAVDDCNVANTDSVTVRVDVTAPTVSCSVGTDQLAANNHEMIDVGFTYDVGDNCSELSSVTVRVTSDEATTATSSGGVTKSPDAELLRDLDGVVTGVRLRAERTGSGNGRVYAIHVTGVDRCRNTQTATCTVSVPPNGNGQAVDSGQLYDATGIN